MNRLELHPDLLEFISCLSRLQSILVQHEQGFWAGKISNVQQFAKNSDGYCVEMFLGLYGGMGSFNDLVLTAPNSANDMLDKERRLAHKLALALR